MRRSLKISLYASLLVIATILIGPGIIGSYFKNHENRLVQQYNKKFPNAKLTIKEYHYGWFRSHASLSLTTPEPLSVILNFKNTIFQGPLYFYKENNHNRIGFGLGGAENQIYLPSLKKPLSLFIHIGFAGNMKANMNIENYSDYSVTLGHVAIHKLAMNLKSSYSDYIDAPKTMTIKICDFKITPPNADIHSEEGITARNVSYFLNFKKQFDAKTHFQIQSLAIKTEPSDQIKISNLRIHLKQKTNTNKKIDTKFHFDIGHINYLSQSPALNSTLSSFLPIGPIALHMDVNGLDHDTALEFDQKLMNDSMPPVSPTATQGKATPTVQAFQSGFMKASQNKALLNEVIKMYSKGLQIKIHPISIATKTDSAAIKLNLNVNPFDAKKGPMGILSHYNLSMNFDVSKGWATLLYQMALHKFLVKSGQPTPAPAGLFNFLISQKIMTDNNGIYGINLTAQNTSAKIGDKDVRQVFGMIMQYLSTAQQPTPTPPPAAKSPASDTSNSIEPTSKKAQPSIEPGVTPTLSKPPHAPAPASKTSPVNAAKVQPTHIENNVEEKK